jgi:hypothetical protein
MSLYTDIVAGVITWTNRPDLTSETDYAIKQALRTAHRAGTFYRDLAVVNLVAQPTTQIQTIDLSLSTPNYKQLCYVKPAGLDMRYAPIDVLDVFDYDKVYKTDVYYGMGTSLIIRAASPVADLDICYYKSPTTSPMSAIDSWIADLHQDLIILWASATILAFIGEQEIKTRVEALAKLARDDLIEDSTELVRR